MSLLSNSDKSFALGDRLLFVGYKGDIESTPIVHNQYEDELITLLFNDTDIYKLPVVETDVDGNTYSVVLLGTQCWMAENLRTLKFKDGNPIPMDTLTSRIIPYVYFPDDDQKNVADYGCLYNWVAVMDGDTTNTTEQVQGICPQGWHMPTTSDWEELLKHVKNNAMYHCKGVQDNIAKALSSTKGWSLSNNNCAVGNDQSANNETGFSAMPAGDYNKTALDFSTRAMFWASSAYENDDSKSYYIGISSNYANITSFYMKKNYGLSVRCLKNKQ